MTPDKIISVIEMYEERLREKGVLKGRIEPHRTFGDLSVRELLSHAYFLCDGVKIYAQDPKEYPKAKSHLTAVQMCLSFAKWYTLEEFMNHNRT